MLTLANCSLSSCPLVLITILLDGPIQFSISVFVPLSLVLSIVLSCIKQNKSWVHCKCQRCSPMFNKGKFDFYTSVIIPSKTTAPKPPLPHPPTHTHTIFNYKNIAKKYLRKDQLMHLRVNPKTAFVHSYSISLFASCVCESEQISQFSHPSFELYHRVMDKLW